MLVFRLVDDRGNILANYNLYLTAGPRYSADDLPVGFFKDRQQNKRNPGKLTYYIDYDKMETGLKDPKLQQKLGLRILAQPGPGPDVLAFYDALEFRSSLPQLAKFLVPNQTLMIEVQMRRKVDKAVFRITDDLNPGPIDGTPLNDLAE